MTDPLPAPGSAPPENAGPVPTGGLTQRVMSGAMWSAGSRFFAQVLQFAIGIALARLLLPEEFGLIASVYVISNFALLFFQMGFTSALIHEPDPSEEQKSTVFWINALGGFVLVGLLAALAPLIANFYGQPDLVWLTPVVALAFTASFGVVHSAMLQRQLLFKKVAVIEISSSLVGSLVTLSLAIAGVGVLSLAIGPVFQSLVASVLSWRAISWRPRSFISLPALRSLWAYSGGLVGFDVVTYWARNADNLLIGRFVGVFQLGLYNRAFNLMLLPVTQVTASLGRVVFPALVTMKGDAPRVRDAYLRAIGLLNALTVPALVGLAASAPGLVPFLWGSAWTGVVPLLQVLCIAGIPQCTTSSVGWLYQSQGETSLMFRMGLLGASVGVASIVVGLHWGALGVAFGVLFRAWAMMPVSLHFAGRSVGLRARTVMLTNAPVLAASLLMGAVVLAVPAVVDLDPSGACVVLAQVLVGIVVYAVLLRVLAPRYFREARQLLRSRRVSL